MDCSIYCFGNTQGHPWTAAYETDKQGGARFSTDPSAPAALKPALLHDYTWAFLCYALHAHLRLLKCSSFPEGLAQKIFYNTSQDNKVSDLFNTCFATLNALIFGFYHS